MTTPAIAPHPAYGLPLQASDMAATFYRVPLTPLGQDDVETVLGLGHVEPRRFAVAANRLCRDVSGFDLSQYCPTAVEAVVEVQHRWAVREPTCTFEGEWEDCPSYPHCVGPSCDYDWFIRYDKGITEATPGAFPVTILVLQ